MKIGFIGAGNMCQAIVSGWVQNNTYKAEDIYATNRSEGKLKRLTEQFGVKALKTNEEIVDICDVGRLRRQSNG